MDPTTAYDLRDRACRGLERVTASCGGVAPAAKRRGDRLELSAGSTDPYPVTPDGRYFVVRGRLWRRTNPHLTDSERAALVSALMKARSAMGRARRNGDAETHAQAKNEVNAAKIALGERGPVWWDDGAPDWNRHLAKNTPYAAWFAAL